MKNNLNLDLPLKQLFLPRKHIAAPSIYLFDKIYNNNFKPSGGIWTSSYNVDFGSEWFQLYYDKDYSFNKKGFILLIYGNPRILVIDSVKKLKNLFRNYSTRKRVYITRHDGQLYLVLTKDRRKRLDFEKISTKYDALHITSELARTMVKVGKNYYFSGFDVESTIWFNLDHLRLLKEIEIQSKWFDYLD